MVLVGSRVKYVWSGLGVGPAFFCPAGPRPIRSGRPVVIGAKQKHQPPTTASLRARRAWQSRQFSGCPLYLGLPEGELPRRGKRGHPGVRRLSAPRNDVVNLASPPDFSGWSLRMAGGSMPRPYRMFQGRSLPFPLRIIFIVHNRENFWHFRRNSLILFQRYCIIVVISERAGTCLFGGLLHGF